MYSQHAFEREYNHAIFTHVKPKYEPRSIDRERWNLSGTQNQESYINRSLHEHEGDIQRFWSNIPGWIDVRQVPVVHLVVRRPPVLDDGVDISVDVPRVHAHLTASNSAREGKRVVSREWERGERRRVDREVRDSGETGFEFFLWMCPWSRCLGIHKSRWSACSIGAA